MLSVGASYWSPLPRLTHRLNPVTSPTMKLKVVSWHRPPAQPVGPVPRLWRTQSAAARPIQHSAHKERRLLSPLRFLARKALPLLPFSWSCCCCCWGGVGLVVSSCSKLCREIFVVSNGFHLGLSFANRGCGDRERDWSFQTARWSAGDDYVLCAAFWCFLPLFKFLLMSWCFECRLSSVFQPSSRCRWGDWGYLFFYFVFVFSWCRTVNANQQVLCFLCKSNCWRVCNAVCN